METLEMLDRNTGFVPYITTEKEPDQSMEEHNPDPAWMPDWDRPIVLTADAGLFPKADRCSLFFSEMPGSA